MKKQFDAPLHALRHIQQLHAYVPGEQPSGTDWVKLNTNESPYPPSPQVGRAITAELDALRLYPEPTSARLRAAIGERFGLDAGHVILGNGSDNLLDLLVRCFAKDPGVGHTVPSYSLYPVVAGMSGQGLLSINFDRGMELPLEAMVDSGAPLFFLTNPNAPTGVAFPLATIEAALQALDGLLVVDEAYVDFGGESAAPLLQEYENLVVVRTFSKSYGLAGLRVGYAMASPCIIEILDRVRDAYNLDRVAQAGALAALEDVADFEKKRSAILATRERTRAVLDGLEWFTYPSAANFLFTEPRNASGDMGSDVAAALFDYLREQRILVRYFPKHPLTCSFIRVSIGTDEDMDRFITAVQSWLNHA
ncbi:MAG: histidinol-phosphate transaminase [Coraliomargaritaceae bacterium]